MVSRKILETAEGWSGGLGGFSCTPMIYLNYFTEIKQNLATLSRVASFAAVVQTMPGARIGEDSRSATVGEREILLCFLGLVGDGFPVPRGSVRLQLLLPLAVFVQCLSASFLRFSFIPAAFQLCGSKKLETFVL